MKSGNRIGQMNAHDTVLDLAAVAVVLPSRTNGVRSTLVSARFIDQPDGLGMSMIASNDLLAPITEPLFIPLDRLEKPL